MKAIQKLIAKTQQARQIETTIADQAVELARLTEKAKTVRTELEGIAWEVVSSIKNSDRTSSERDVSSATSVLRSLGLDAAASALELQD